MLLLLGLAQGQVVRSFQFAYNQNTNGNILIIGNTLMTCGNSTVTPTNPPTCNANDTGLNNNQQMVFVDFDSDATTSNSSRATLSLPSGASVIFAGLYWGARANPSATTRNQIRFRTSGAGAYQTITATWLETITTQGTATTRPYAAFADVTALVQPAGSGDYWVAGITAATGNDGLGFYAGWSLVVVYQHPSEPLRRLSVSHGLAVVSSGNNVTQTISGLLTPLVGTVEAQIGSVAWEGDGGITGDQFQIRPTGSPTWQNLSDSQNPANNFFNSSISRLGSRFSAKLPDYVNQFALDADLVQYNGLPNGTTSVDLQFTSTGDTYFPQVLTFAVNLYLPDLTTTFTKSVQDLNGGSVLLGDVLEYTLSFSNTGADGATNIVLRDPIPTHTQYVPGSLQVLTNATGAPTGTFTDAAGDDIAEYAASCPEFSGAPCVRFRLGTGANASSGGLILPAQGASVRFRVQVLPSAAGQTITNTAQVSYNSQTLGTGFSQTASVSANSPVPNPPTLSKTFTPASIPVGGTSTLTITLANPNPTPATLSAALVDNLPAGVVVASPAGAGTTCPGGSVTTSPGSGTVTLNSGAQIPANASCTVSVNVTASSPGNYTNTLPAGALQTNLGSNTSPASAVLSVTGVALSGQVYHDLEPNGVNNSENWSGAPTVYVKLVQGTSVLAVQTVSAGSGAYSFSGVAPGTYTLVLDNNASTSDTTPTPPTGWLFINPTGGSRTVTVSSTNVLGQDFGLFHGFRVEGRVFYDDGESGGNANNALQDGSERGVGGVTVTASDGSSTRTATTDGSGFYQLYIPASWGSVTLSHPIRPATGRNDGSTASQTLSWADATSPTSSGAVVSLGSAGSLAGATYVRNFGVVRPSLLSPDQAGQATSPGVITYAHQYKPGTLGNATLSLAPTQFGYQVRRDVNCDGDFDDPGEGFQGLPLSFSVNASWPRESDGSLRGCALEVRVIVPAGLSAGQVDLAPFSLSLAWASNPAVVEARSLTDTTTVIRGGELRLTKQARNHTQNTSFASSAQGRPGEVLEYRIEYQNIGSQPIFNVILFDPVPFFTTLVQNAYGTSGEVELVCPNGAVVRPDLGPVSNLSLNLASLCTLSTAPLPGGGTAPALLPGQGGYFVYRVQVN
jgi:uncharacterized repeat protein (TIGR01451 family)